MVIFKEVLPNPSGSDIEGEWIKLINNGDNPVSLSGWLLSDESGKVFSFSNLKPKDRELAPGKEIILPYSVSKLTLNNGGEKLKLINSNGEIEDTLDYIGPIGNDEIVFGNEFVKNSTNGKMSLAQISENEFDSLSPFNSGADFSPIIIATIMAIVFSIGVGFIVKRFIEEE